MTIGACYRVFTEFFLFVNAESDRCGSLADSNGEPHRRGRRKKQTNRKKKKKKKKKKKEEDDGCAGGAPD